MLSAPFTTDGPGACVAGSAPICPSACPGSAFNDQEPAACRGRPTLSPQGSRTARPVLLDPTPPPPVPACKCGSVDALASAVVRALAAAGHVQVRVHLNVGSSDQACLMSTGTIVCTLCSAGTFSNITGAFALRLCLRHTNTHRASVRPCSSR